MIISNKKIIIDGYQLENWHHVNWLIKMLEQNGKMLWGERGEVKKPEAKILKLVRDKDDNS